MWWNALLLALRAIRRNVMRSVLTVLGIVIGVAAVIAMVNLGGGATAKVSNQITSLGTNLLIVRPGQRVGPGESSVAPPFKYKDLEAIRRDVYGIAAAAPSASSSMKAIFGNLNHATTVMGTDNAFFSVRNWTFEEGRDFSDAELASGKAVCVIGSTIRTELFGAQDPMGVDIRLGKFSCTVIGLLQSKGQGAMGIDQDDLVVIPLRTFWRRVAGNQDVSMIQVSARDGVSTAKVKADIDRLLRERRHIGANEDDDFQVRDMKEVADAFNSTMGVLTALLGAVAAVSLLVGGIGIMNIMLVSVTERTREIGIRLAIGAMAREVLLQFLVESVVLSSLGGVFGILLALLASWGLARGLDVPLIINVPMIVIAFLFSALVGVVFGYFPARRAAKLDPIEALRHE